MKAIHLTDIRKMELTDVPTPAIKDPRDVLLKLEKVGVCGSDVHYYVTGKIGSQIVEYPFIVGHECAATVAEIGPDVDRVRVGDPVAVDPAMVCHQCDQCRAGRENTCRNLRFLGCPGQAAGCLCEYIVMPQDSVFPLGNKVTLDQAVLSEPLSIGVYTVKQADLPADADVAILGAGPIGLSALAAARAQGIRAAYITDKIDRRVDIARQAGAEFAGKADTDDVVSAILDQRPAGMDAVFECAGQQDTVDQAIELLKPGGKLMLVGIPQVERISVVIDRARRKEITIVNVRRQNHCVKPTLDLLATGEIKVDFMITHRYGLDRTQEAFDLVDQYGDGVIKAMIEF